VLLRASTLEGQGTFEVELRREEGADGWVCELRIGEDVQGKRGTWSTRDAERRWAVDSGGNARLDDVFERPDGGRDGKTEFRLNPNPAPPGLPEE
jgi:hypothetical protein